MIILEFLIFAVLIQIITTILIGGLIMANVQAGVKAVQDAITALQARLSTGVVVQQSDLDAAATALNTAAQAIGQIAP